MTPDTAFADRLDAFFPDAPPARIGLAVSGGGDSMALLHLAAGWAVGPDVALHVASVDHGLRAEAAAEAQLVARAAARLDLPHDTLTWSGWDGQGNLQDAARRARRGLIESWAAGRGIAHVLTGHTADDQAETVLMRLARGSGVDGLAGMAESEMHGCTWLRPLLGLRRAALRDWLRDRGVDWVDDPSNDDARFDRVRARAMLATLGDLGLTVDRLTETARHMRAARQVLDAAAADLAARAVTQDRGDLLIDRATLDAAPRDTRLRLLARALVWVSGNPYRPRFAALEALAQQGGSLHGCLVSPVREGLRVSREYKAVAETTCKTDEIWDGRWQLSGPHAPDLAIRALGDDGARHCPDRRDSGLPHRSLIASPAIWRENRLIAAPLAGLAAGWRAELAPGRGDFAAWLELH